MISPNLFYGMLTTFVFTLSLGIWLSYKIGYREGFQYGREYQKRLSRWVKEHLIKD